MISLIIIQVFLAIVSLSLPRHLHLLREKISSRAFQALWVEFQFEMKSNITCGVIYKQHNSPESFQTYFDETLEKRRTSGKPIYVMGDFNISLLNAETCSFTEDFLLFLMYINDIYNSSKKLSFYLCVDDTNLLYAEKDLKSLESVIIVELQKVCDWLNANKLTINAKKFNFVIFRPSQKKLRFRLI